MPTGRLPKEGKAIWESVYKEARSSGDSQETASQKAWGAVKNAGWRKTKNGWEKKSELVEMSMYITKASLDGKVMRWSATNSDTAPDSYDERMSLELFRDFISRIKGEIDTPQQFKSSVVSDYWRGGMPYVSVSHYPDNNGSAVPGEVLEIYIDGNKLKAKGILYDTPLGRAVYKSLKEDKDKPVNERIRISIGFIDLAHAHENRMFVRESQYSLCPDCLQGVGNKVYVKGFLVHLAMTRKPVNKRTEMVLEE